MGVNDVAVNVHQALSDGARGQRGGAPGVPPHGALRGLPAHRLGALPPGRAWSRAATHPLFGLKWALKISVGVTSHPDLLEIDGLFTQGWQTGRTSGESVGGMFEMDSSNWSKGIRYHIFDTRSDTEFKCGIRWVLEGFR